MGLKNVRLVLFTFKECSSCGALHNKSCVCSKGGFVDKFVSDPNKTPDLSQRPPNCPKCGDPVDGLYCRRCALLRKKLEEVWFTIYDENEILNTSESSNDNTNVVNMPQEPFVFNQDPSKNSSQYENSFTNDSNFVDDSPNPPPQPSTYSYEFCGNDANSQPPTYSCEFCGNDAHSGYDSPPQKIPIYYDNDDDEESSIPLRDIIISGLPPCIAITPVLTTKEPVDSLIMEDEHLGTISAMESDEFIKSSAENLVPTPSESEDASDGVCDLPVCDDFPKSHLVTFSNPLFDIDDDCTSSDDESFSEEDVPMENFKFFSNPLFDLDEEIVSTEVNLIQNEVLESITSIPPGIDSFYAESNLIESLLNRNTSIDSSSKIDSLLDEFAGELTLLKSIPPGIDDDNLDPEGEIHLVERLLYDNSSSRPLKELNVENSIKSFSPSPIPVKDSDSLIEEIDVFLASDGSIPPGIESDDYDLEGDDNSTSFPELESFHVDYPDLGDSTIDVVEDIPIDVPNILRRVPDIHLKGEK
ncbi:hypothetical protein Tco_0262655 [Tanacetum coccineum]